MSSFARRPFLMGCVTGGVLTVTIAAVALGAAVLLGRTYARPFVAEQLAERMDPPAIPNLEADYSWTITGADGQGFPMEQLRGRPFLLALWKPECVACTAELPTIQALADALADTDLVVLPLAVKVTESIGADASQAGLRIPYYTYTDELPLAFRPGAVPAVFVVDRTGRIVMSHTGAAKWDDPSVIDFVRTIAERPAVTPAL